MPIYSSCCNLRPNTFQDSAIVSANYNNSVQLRPVTSENLAFFSRKYELVFMVSKVPVLHSWYLYESIIQVLSVEYLTNRNQLTT